MRKLLTALGVALALTATAQEPIITFKTNLTGQTAADGVGFHIELGTTETTYMDVDCGYGKTEYEVSPAVLDPETKVVNGTVISLPASADGIVSIYGDASLIDYFYAPGCYIEWIDLGECTNLDILDLQHNQLQRLDLSKYNKLSAIYLTDNPFTAETPLVIGEDHPNLMILEVDIVDYISPDFDITTYPQLVSFDAYANKTLTHLDPTKCPYLMRLSVDLCPISSLDVTKNPLLTVLNIEDTRITEIDVTQNPELRELYTNKQSGSINKGYKLSGIDVTKNPKLYYLTVAGNGLTELDVTGNPLLTHLYAKENKLTNIDLSKNEYLYVIDLSKNDFGFSTLPLPLPTWGDYTYAQNPLSVDRSYPVGRELDFSDKVLREGTATEAVLYAYNAATNESTALDSEYYTFNNGRVTLLKESADSVFVSFSNTSFPDARLTTDKFMVKSADEYGKPSRVANFTTSVSSGKELAFNIGLSGASAESPRKMYVDFGDGEQVEYTITTDALTSTPNVTGTKKGIGAVNLYIPENEVLTAFGADGIPMYTVNFAGATELRQLKVTDAGLSRIDLSMNRCLTSLDLSGNKFAELSLEGANGAYGKNMLSHINVSDNLLTDITLNDTRTITHLDLSGNQLAVFDYKEFDNMVSLDLSDNKLSTVNIAYMTLATDINLSGNNLEEVMMPETNSLSTFDLRNNDFTLANLPIVEGCPTYLYAPQADILLPKKGPGANLSAQNRVIDGVGTTFTWLTADGTPLTAEQVTVTDGKSSFHDTTVGQVYCRMTNPAFPAFDDATPFRTTLIEATEMPTNVLASFTTTTGGQTAQLSMAAAEAGTTVYIDWSGDGYTLEPYQLKTTYTLFDATTVANANVKIYTYGDDETLTVFSISGVSMSDIDIASLDKAYCISISDAGLADIKLPAADIRELMLPGNELTTLDLTPYPNLESLSLSSNKLTEIDLSPFKKLALVSIGHNELDKVVLDNPSLWFLDLSDNNLESIDLSKATGIEQLSLSSNNLSQIDISPLSRLRQLVISQNYFTFATLPRPQASFESFYEFVNQYPMKAECADGKVDLSAQAMVNETATEFTWYIGVPEFDENGVLVGEDLYEGTEYTLEDGVTTFLKDFDNVMCVMTNGVYPNLYLYTDMLNAKSGVNDIAADDASVSVTVLNGTITVNADMEDGTPVALIALDGRTVGRTSLNGGSATLTAAPGTAILAIGNRAVKVNVK